MDTRWATLADEARIKKTVEALAHNGIQALVVENGAEAKKKVLELLPAGAEVMNMTSVTLETIGLAKEINESGNFVSVRKQLMAMDRNSQALEMRRLGAAHQYAVGSVHAVTEDGKVLIASNTGSQLGSYAYGASQVIWVVGTQKIVGNLDEATRRVYEYVLPLESERAREAYGVPGSFVSKLLIFNKEIQPKRVTIILVKEVLGF